MDFLFVPVGKGYNKIRISSLLYIRAGMLYTEMVTTEGIVITSASIDQLEKRLRKKCCRIHRGYLVALDKVIAFDGHSVELPGIILPLEKRFSAGFRQCVRIVDPFVYPGPYRTLAVDAHGLLTGI